MTKRKGESYLGGHTIWTWRDFPADESDSSSRRHVKERGAKAIAREEKLRRKQERLEIDLKSASNRLRVLQRTQARTLYDIFWTRTRNLLEGSGNFQRTASDWNREMFMTVEFGQWDVEMLKLLSSRLVEFGNQLSRPRTPDKKPRNHKHLLRSKNIIDNKLGNLEPNKLTKEEFGLRNAIRIQFTALKIAECERLMGVGSFGFKAFAVQTNQKLSRWPDLVLSDVANNLNSMGWRTPNGNLWSSDMVAVFVQLFAKQEHGMRQNNKRRSMRRFGGD